MAKDIKKDLAAARLDAENRMREVDFQVDTLSNETTTGAYFLSGDNTLTINYVEGEDSFNSWSGSMAVLMHEQKHRDNQAQGMYAYAISPEQAYKINMHDEISANMASLVYLRDKYLKTGDISVFEEDDLRFCFYTDAIKKGEINPFSNKKEDFDKEMALIANGTRDMWVRDFSGTYVEQNAGNAKSYGEKDGKHAAYYDQNYERARKIAYTIGGVDFTQYMDKDVEIPDAGKRRIMGSEKLPEGDDKAYNKAVDELYSGKVKFNQEDLKFEGKVNLRQAFNPKDDLPLKELPKEAAELQQKVEDMGWWKRGVKQYTHFFGETKEMNGLDKLPAVVRYPAEALGVYVGVPVIAGIKKCGEWGSDAVDAVKGWFGNDADKNKGENKPVRPVDKDKKPEYREWSPKERVSDVQKKEVLNLMADVIRKPDGRGKPDEVMAKKGRQAGQTGAEQKQAERDALKGDMQKAAQDKARMMQVIEGMNRINGARNAMDAGGTVNALYDKFGDNAYELLAKAVNEPYNFAQSVGDTSIKTSRAAVLALCNADEAQKNAMVQAVLKARGR